MKLCIPVTEDKGLESPICSHFGSAPLFLIVETNDNSYHSKANQNLHHGHGMCQPLSSLSGESIEGMLVGGIGLGAYNKLKAANMKVYMAEYNTVAEAIAALKEGKLQEVTMDSVCAHHGHEEGHQPNGYCHGQQ